MSDLQRRLLLGDEPDQLSLLHECCATPEGLAWCRQRFNLEDLLEMMRRQGRGDSALLELWEPPQALRPLIRGLLPGNQEDLADLLFPNAGTYRLDVETGWHGEHPISIKGRLAQLVVAAVLNLKHLPHGLHANRTASGMVVRPLAEGTRIALAQCRLEESGAEILAYGAKDTGDMGSGTAVALLAKAGPELEAAARQALAHLPREIGTAFLTPAFGLTQDGTRWICHIVSIHKHTPQGAYCPDPELLEEGVGQALRLAQEKGVDSMAFSALGTGEGRVQPDHCARMMLGAARRFFREHPDSPLRLQFCLLDEQDLEAFEREMSHT